MEGIFFILFIIIFTITINNIRSAHKPLCQQGHIWIRDEEGLVCNQCKKRPGQL